MMILKIDIYKFLRDISVKKIIYIAGAVGLLMIFLSSRLDTEKQVVSVVEDDFDYCSILEERLEEILPEISGVGNVSVMVTAKNYGKITLAKDTSESGEETLILNQKGGGEDAKIIEESYPSIEGVIIVAEGGGNSKVKESLSNAVEALLGVEAHKIKVYERAINK